MIPYALKVNGRERPMEVDSALIRFTWRYRDPQSTGDRVEAVRLTLLDAAGLVAFDSGVAPGDDVAMSCPSDRLHSTSTYRWTIAIRTTSGGWNAASDSFETGLLGRVLRDTRWIGRDPHPWFDDDGELRDSRPASRLASTWRTVYVQPPLQLRRRFALRASPSRARLLISARGIYRAALNGHRVGQDELTPGWTGYQHRIQYQRYDVTALLQPGHNALAVEVADGWWSGYLGYDPRAQARQYGDAPMLLAQLVVDLDDGSRSVVSTDSHWVERSGARVAADLLMGELVDGDLDTPGWQEADYDDSAWRPASALDDDTAMLRGQAAEPVRVVEEIPCTVVHQDDRRTIVDFGTNLTGWVRLRLSEPAHGRVITIRHAEALDDGELYTDNLRTAEAVDRYRVAAGQTELEPAFTFHGFRYAEISGLNSPIDAASVTGLVLSSDLEHVGSLTTSSPLINSLLLNIRRSQVGNFVGLPTDCPQRDERLGWTADAQVFAPTAAYQQDVDAFLRSWLTDLQDAQDPGGTVPDIAPVPPRAIGFDEAAPGWGDAITILPWTLYERYGDLDALRADLPFMRAWVDRVWSLAHGDLWTSALGQNFGDWLSIDAHTPKTLLAAAYQIRSTDLTARAAAALHDPAAELYAHRAAHLRRRFAEVHLDGDDLRRPTQTGYLMALAWNLVPEARSALAAGLIEDLEAHDIRLTTGFHGVALLGPVLTAIGRSDLAYALVLDQRFPSWGYSIAHGATSIWERWDGWTATGGFQDPRMNSFNHYSLGSIGEWLWSGMGGIAPQTPGWRSIRIAPQLTDRLDHTSARLETPRGAVAVDWRRIGEDIVVAVTVPPGSTGHVHLPGVDDVVGQGVHRWTIPRARIAVRPVALSPVSNGG